MKKLPFVFLLLGVSMTSASPANDTLLYVGTYTRAESKGIYAFKLQNDTLVPLGLAGEAANPSFLEIDAARGVLFAVNEVAESDGQPTGAVSAFSIDRATGKLTLLNRQSSKGRGPCYVVLDRTKRNVLVANYGSGTVAVLPVAADGRLGEATAVVQHTGSSVNPKRQEGPHAHCMAVDPANRFAFACDLGADKIFIYRFDAAKGTLTPNDPASVSLEPGAGPRHMVFGRDGRYAYVTNELHSTVTAFAYDARAGALKELQTVSTLPQGFTGSNTTAEVTIHPSGKYLYVSNRGHDSIAIFNVDAAKGTLTFVDAQSTQGKMPRHFGVSPSGEHLGIANQASGSVVLGRIDPATGRFTASGAPAPVSMPTYVKFLLPQAAAPR